MSEERNQRKTRVGVVTSDKMDKTICVAVERKTQHPMYKRVVRQTKKYKAHDEKNVCNEGDQVRIMETRPQSKGKRWRVIDIIRKAK